MGLVDKEEVTQDTEAFSTYLGNSIDQWLDLLAEPCVRQSDVHTVLRLLRLARMNSLDLKHDPSDLNACPYLLTGTITATRDQKLWDEDYLGPGSRSDEQSTATLEVRAKVFGPLLAPLPAASGKTIDQGTTVDFAGSYEHENSTLGACADNWDYRYDFGVLGPYRGPVTSIVAETGDTGRIGITVSWTYAIHGYEVWQVPDLNGCDWANHRNQHRGVRVAGPDRPRRQERHHLPVHRTASLGSLHGSVRHAHRHRGRRVAPRPTDCPAPARPTVYTAQLRDHPWRSAVDIRCSTHHRETRSPACVSFNASPDGQQPMCWYPPDGDPRTADHRPESRAGARYMASHDRRLQRP